MPPAKASYRIAWRPKAREDLRAIVRYIDQDDPAKARAFAQSLHDKTLPLARHPNLGRPGRPGLPDAVRELIAHRNYIVFYRVLPEARIVEILRVKHRAQQAP
ncbi:type II toxin-antitoxin system RelE/ParE family toxin [Methylobacterium sp. J-072]|uniref:type II toxin-antitoxin system RelE/ParE family toxin n=1 Tax=Methylobacterium sp. J-072 TaxID=2836651 RepID=UPI001FB8EE57|nr:type II toxin-antitoxin system RelE/ParE family toxin [Methylobacterium sp. J-072]MCJ2094894.1 type II toxin-antitoxin system RelE/ParE family toxin [Methylobacterium sp. J-072]